MNPTTLFAQSSDRHRASEAVGLLHRPHFHSPRILLHVRKFPAASGLHRSRLSVMQQMRIMTEFAMLGRTIIALYVAQWNSVASRIALFMFGY